VVSRIPSLSKRFFGDQPLQVFVDRLPGNMEMRRGYFGYITWMLFDVLKYEPPNIFSSRPNLGHLKTSPLIIVNLTIKHCQPYGEYCQPYG
jgi:hypothetical protein